MVRHGTNDYTITPASGTSEIYVAIPGISGQTVTLTATVGDDTYTYEKSGVAFTNGQYYEITVKMTKQAAAPTYPVALSAVKSDIYVGSVITSDGMVYANASAATAASTTAVAIIAYVGSAGSVDDSNDSNDSYKGLAIAMSDAGDD